MCFLAHRSHAYLLVQKARAALRLDIQIPSWCVVRPGAPQQHSARPAHGVTERTLLGPQRPQPGLGELPHSAGSIIQLRVRAPLNVERRLVLWPIALCIFRQKPTSAPHQWSGLHHVDIRELYGHQ